ncbi:N-methyl-L-tryptophan oxidase [Indiicoccus explosivorum]|uniref:N-methyl-L-tryptophan oxidase n=1 Tax=Indiicoccus explosivorum TaxID=1917864 RepID=UPI000B44148A|nr:N-methyl-L-tryptophan oxidase [Indiicoccus explosivorum]
MEADVIIIGAGSMGMAAGYYLARANRKVVLIDSNDPPHTEGSHHGKTRLIRHAYGEGEQYVPMALRAQELWLELERDSGRKVFHQTGVLNIGTPESDFLKNVFRSAETYSLPTEKLSSKEVNDRWSGFRLPDGLVACFEKNSGVLMSEEAIRAYRELAEQQDAALLMNTRVQKLQTDGDCISVTAGGTLITGKKLIITAGKGTNSVLQLLGRQLPLQPMRTHVSWFEADTELYRPDIFPAWAYDDGDSGFYGFPDIEGAGLKIGNHQAGSPVLPEEKLKPFGAVPGDGKDVSDFLSLHMGVDPILRTAQVCTYTDSPDGDFIIDQLPGYGNVIVACGFSGHGFKFASVVGEILMELTICGRTSLDITGFAACRFD